MTDSRTSNQHVCPRCGLPIAYGEKQVGNTECGVAHTPERCCALLRMARASSGAEIERLRARRDELDRANVGLATESERLRAALNTALRCLQAALGPGWEVKPLPADEREKEHG